MRPGIAVKSRAPRMLTVQNLFGSSPAVKFGAF